MGNFSDKTECCKFDECLKKLNDRYTDAKCEGCIESDYILEKNRLDRYVELEKLIILAEKCGDTSYVSSLYDEQEAICIGVTPPKVIFGCTDSSAPLYNPNATHSCITNGVVNGCCYGPVNKVSGCLDPTANNYNPAAQINQPGICTYNKPGCTDVNAFDYDPSANLDCNGDSIGMQNTDWDSCCCKTAGCTDPSANNYDPSACYNNGSCAYSYGCMNPASWSAATSSTGSLLAGYEDYDPNNTHDCVNVQGGTDDSCCCLISGCTDSTAFNYNPNACHDDGSCCLIGGCTDPTATNYNPSACHDDGSCCTLTASVSVDVQPTNGLSNDGTIEINATYNPLFDYIIEVTKDGTYLGAHQWTTNSGTYNSSGTNIGYLGYVGGSLVINSSSFNGELSWGNYSIKIIQVHKNTQNITGCQVTETLLLTPINPLIVSFNKNGGVLSSTCAQRFSIDVSMYDGSNLPDASYEYSFFLTVSGNTTIQYITGNNPLTSLGANINIVTALRCTNGYMEVPFEDPISSTSIYHNWNELCKYITSNSNNINAVSVRVDAFDISTGSIIHRSNISSQIELIAGTSQFPNGNANFNMTCNGGGQCI